ncbi:MAG: rhomboid family intramembrane serine protease [Candidatus Lokiarchaeota archaeon]|nr:rhomboid family intramembrane serine protease [Candidatus Lokiarchaeota archaeon]
MFILDASNIKEARITIFLISINVFLYVFFLFTSEDVVFLFVQINSRIIYDLEIWRLFTAMFLHGDALHLFSNMIALLIFGAYIESNYSKYQFVTIYFLSGLMGNIFSVILLPPYTISLGASGAIFGLIGAAFLIIILRRDTPLIFIGLLYVFYFIFSSFSPQINYFAHIFGLIGGFILGYLFKRSKNYFKRY